MSFDVFVQKFQDGDAGTADEEVIRAVLAPYFKEGDTAMLHCADGTADLYGWDSLSHGFMVNHAGGTDIWDVLVLVARAARLAIMPIGCPTAVTSPSDIDDLPDGLRQHAVVVRDGQDLLGIIRGI